MPFESLWSGLRVSFRNCLLIRHSLCTCGIGPWASFTAVLPIGNVPADFCDVRAVSSGICLSCASLRTCLRASLWASCCAEVVVHYSGLPEYLSYRALRSVLPVTSLQWHAVLPDNFNNRSPSTDLPTELALFPKTSNVARHVTHVSLTALYLAGGLMKRDLRISRFPFGPSRISEVPTLGLNHTPTSHLESAHSRSSRLFISRCTAQSRFGPQVSRSLALPGENWFRSCCVQWPSTRESRSTPLLLSDMSTYPSLSATQSHCPWGHNQSSCLLN
jgi:hypothetical protein